METQRWTVSELTRYLREQFESDPRLQDTEVEGEVSDFRIPGSGHAYFTLKDADATLQCVMWRSQLLAHRGDLPKHGDRVIAEGYISIYEPRGQYQLYCRRLRPAGRGDLHAEFERLKEKLAAEGLFDAERKRPVPVSPAVIGIGTSPSTAGTQDGLNVHRRRRPQVRVVLSPTPVQGESAPPQIIRALEALNTQADVEVILLVRGGGSIEDLWCFNDEDLARAVAASRIPVIAGVGHEIDFTLVDFAADLRAPTPSAAAELATPITADHLRADVQRLSQRLFNAAALRTAEQRRAYEQAMYALRRLSPRAAIDNARQQVDGLVSRATRAVQSRFALRRSELAGLKRALKSMSPMETLARGYAIVQGPDGLVLHDPAQVRPGDRLHIRLEKGPLRATVDEEQDGIP